MPDVVLTNLRMLKLLPLTFIAGEEGFTLAAPYLVVALGVIYAVRRRTSPIAA
ncbi:MAG: hypothetical protein AAF743_05260 [Planctomycetota bacterium]